MLMRPPRFAEPNLSAVIGAVIGAVGGLIAVTLPYAIMTRDISALSAARTLALIGFLVSTPVAWIIGGQIGPRLEKLLGERASSIVGGIIGGLLPVAGFMYWGYKLATG